MKLTTDRLILNPLSENDRFFILELVNTAGWIKFIGDRNVHSEIDAIAYINKINNNPNVKCWTVQLKTTNASIGLITFIKRDYLEHNDIGFAILPSYFGVGYAFEATKEVLNFLVTHHPLSQILATTIPENTKSIALLKKLGLRFEKSIEIENEILHVYQSSTENLLLSDQLIIPN